MLQVLAFLVMSSVAYCQIAAAYNPHLCLVTAESGFAMNGVMAGNSPSPANAAYPDLASAHDRIDRFEMSVFWKSNPPITPSEAKRLQSLEAWAKTVPDPHVNIPNFMELSYFHTKILKSQRKPVELEIDLFLPDVGATVQATDYEFYADLCEAPTEPAYFPGLSINHRALNVAVNAATIRYLPVPWSHAWQPISVHGHFPTMNGIGSFDIRFIRHESRLTAIGTLSPRPGVKLSVVSKATYNGTIDPTLPSRSEPPFYPFLDASGQNWKNSPVDLSQFNPRYADPSQI